MRDKLTRPRPSEEQLQRFGGLSAAERYAWICSVLRTTHGLAAEATRARWRERKLVESGGFVSNVAALVHALDRAAFEEAETTLAPAAIYEKEDAVITGAAAIVASYRSSHDRGSGLLDAIVYRSRLEPIAPGVVRVTFEDQLEARGCTHRYRCVQEMTVGRTKLVERIVHRELDGERAALAAFLSALAPPSSP